MLRNEHLFLSTILTAYVEETGDKDHELIQYAEELNALPMIHDDLGYGKLPHKFDEVLKLNESSTAKELGDVIALLELIPKHLSYSYFKVYSYYINKFKRVISYADTEINPLIPFSNSMFLDRVKSMEEYVVGKFTINDMLILTDDDFEFIKLLLFTGLIKENEYCKNTYKGIKDELEEILKTWGGRSFPIFFGVGEPLLFNDIDFVRDILSEDRFKESGLIFTQDLFMKLNSIYNFIIKVETVLNNLER